MDAGPPRAEKYPDAKISGGAQIYSFKKINKYFPFSKNDSFTDLLSYILSGVIFYLFFLQNFIFYINKKHPCRFDFINVNGLMISWWMPSTNLHIILFTTIIVMCDVKSTTWMIHTTIKNYQALNRSYTYIIINFMCRKITRRLVKPGTVRILSYFR